jgi:hypothetical protein
VGIGNEDSGGNEDILLQELIVLQKELSLGIRRTLAFRFIYAGEVERG